jgi:3-isopropylmalate/(R)-2-methylmalate dehydratase large subunit
MSLTLYEKLWNAHTVRTEPDGTVLLYIDRHLIHEVTSPQAFEGLRQEKRPLWRKDSILATADHNTPTDQMDQIFDPISRLQVDTLNRNCLEYGVLQFPMGDSRQGIVHVIGPEQGAVLPGMTVVCGDSHTSTLGAFAALAMGIGTSEVEHVFATQTLLQKKAKTMAVQVHGELPHGVSAKDLALSVIQMIGTAGGTGYALEFMGPAIEALSMEGRMTLCNMAIEAGAKTGLVAVDDKTIHYLMHRPMAPKGAQWEEAIHYWKTLRSDEGSVFDKVVHLEAAQLFPMVSWGTSPEMVVGLHEQVPNPADYSDSVKRSGMMSALKYMDLVPKQKISEIFVDKVFVGSCTNSRIEDLRVVAKLVRGKKRAQTITQVLIVPGSALVKKMAELEGLDQIFIEAGFEWRFAGCSMCLGMNEDKLSPGERCASTSNRNFEGRQGAGGRTHLVSPAIAAITAILGHFPNLSQYQDAMQRGDLI